MENNLLEQNAPVDTHPLNDAKRTSLLSWIKAYFIAGPSRVEWRGASQPRALPEPDVSLSTHPAPIVQPRPQVANARAEWAALT